MSQKQPQKGQSQQQKGSPAQKAASPTPTQEPKSPKPVPEPAAEKQPAQKAPSKQAGKGQPPQQAAKSPAAQPEPEKAQPAKSQKQPAPAKAASPAPAQEPKGKQQAPAKAATTAEPKGKQQAPAKAAAEPAKGKQQAPAKAEPAKGQAQKSAPQKSAAPQKAGAPAKGQPQKGKDQGAGQKRKAGEGAGGAGDGGDDKRPPVPERIKKRRLTKKELLEAWQNYVRKGRTDRKKLRLQAYTRARKYEKEYKDAEKDLIAKRRQARNTGNFFVEPEAKIAVVVRIRGIMGVSPKVKKILRLLRLRQLHNATFVKLTPPMSKMLKLVEPYIAYGYPNLKTVRSLIYKRGFASVKGQRLRIVDNTIVNKNLKRYNVVCVEDIVHELYTCGANFKYVNRFLWPFKLNPPRGGFIKKRVHFTEGGDAGNREHYINKLVRRML